MFIGHFAVGFAAKKWAPRRSLALLLLAPLLADVLWPVFVLLGWERFRIVPGTTAFNPIALDDFPWSHSLAMDGLWALLLGGAVWLATKDRAGSLVVAAGVLSHWVLDWVTHAPDMPLWPGGAEYGLGLWNSIVGTYVIEGALFALGVGLYLSATRAKDRVGTVALWALVVLLVALWAPGPFGPPPPANMVAASALVATPVFLAWALWVDRHREAA